MVDIDVKSIERSLLKEKFPGEAKQIIGVDGLSDYETKLLNKCINHNPINEEEFTDLKRLLNDYRPYLNKYKPEETLEAIDKTKRIIQTEQDFLDMVDNTHNELHINIPFQGELYPVTLEILPLSDSSAIKALSHHIDLFNEYNPDDILTFNKAQEGEELNPKEQALVDKMTKEIEDKASENRIVTTNEFLASQTRLKGSNADYNTRLRFWQKFNFAAKFAISFRVEEILGLKEDITESLFRDDE